MLLMGNFILNRTEKKESHMLFPGIHVPNNKLTQEDFFRPIKFPDVDLVESLHPDADFSMVAGEFEEVYSKEPGRPYDDVLEAWDAVATCFFIDTAHNIVEYLQTIYNILKPGGLWLNLGPLLYHYADMPNEESIELTWEEVLFVAEQIGFDIELEETVRSTYCSVGQPMLETVYISKLIKARKRLVKGST